MTYTMQKIDEILSRDRAEYRETARRMRADADTLAAVFAETRDSTPAETVATYVNRIGYERAAACIASIVNRCAWDGRISPCCAEWAKTVDGAADEDAASRMSIDAPSIHRTHLDQIADAMRKYHTPGEAYAEYRARLRSAETVEAVEAVKAEAARDGRISPAIYDAILRRAASRAAFIEAEQQQQREAAEAEQAAAAETETEPEAAERPAAGPVVVAPAGYTAAEAVAAITGGPALLHRVSITVPSTSGPSTPATPETVAYWIARTMRALSDTFGGCTAVNGLGAWVDGRGRLISEAVTVCTSYADSITAEAIEAVKAAAEAIRAGMNQDAVTIEIDGAAGFIERPAEQAAEAAAET